MAEEGKGGGDDLLGSKFYFIDDQKLRVKRSNLVVSFLTASFPFDELLAMPKGSKEDHTSEFLDTLMIVQIVIF